MSVLNNSNAISTGGAYNITDSLRFRSSGSTYLSRVSTGASSVTKYTLSFWMKRGSLGSTQGIATFYSANVTYGNFYINSSDQLYLYSVLGSVVRVNGSFAPLLRDTSAWYHIVLSVDTTHATASERCVVYINNVKYSNSYTITQNNYAPLFYWTNPDDTKIGAYQNATSTPSNYFDGYMTEMHHVDGQALDASDFGETNDDGVWSPKEYTGTYGTNGFYLPMKETTQADGFNTVLYTGNDGSDVKITGVGFSPDLVWTKTRGVARSHWLMDSVRGTSVALSTDTTSADTSLSGEFDSFDSDGFTISHVSGQGRLNYTGRDYVAWCWEAGGTDYTTYAGLFNGSNQYLSIASCNAITFGTADYTVEAWIKQTSQSKYEFIVGGLSTCFQLGILATGQLQGSLAGGTTLGASTGKVPVGVWTHVAMSRSSNTVTYYINGINAGSVTDNNNYSLATTTVNLGATGNNPATYGFSGQISNLRVIKGTANYTANFNPPVTDLTAVTNTSLLTLQDSTFIDNSTNGFTISNTGTVTLESVTASTPSRNTDGSITSTVRANPATGFSVVTYTGDGSSSATVGHGLGTTPSMIIAKSRSSTQNWRVYHSSFGTTTSNTLYLNLQNAVSTTDSERISAVASDTFTVTQTTGGALNASGQNYVAFCFSEVSGYSKMGSFTGNATAGNSVTGLGFKPAWIMFKNSNDGGESWYILDSTRSVNDTRYHKLNPDSSGAESTSTVNNLVDFDDDGFTIQSTNAGLNGNGNTIIYMAFADTRDYQWNFDASGNKNNWTPNNINSNASSETTYDLMSDTPSLADEDTGNFATLNPLKVNGGTISNGNLTYTASASSWQNSSTTIFSNTGKWYFEANIIARPVSYGCMIGIGTPDSNTSTTYSGSYDTFTYLSDGTKYGNGSAGGSYGATFTAGDIIGVAFDCDAGTITFYKNGVSQGVAFTNLVSGSHYGAWLGVHTSASSVALNFGQRPFAYTPPTGYKKLNTFNLPDSSITDGSDYMNTVTYTGTGASQSITTGFSPDFVWLKSRSYADHPIVYDTVRGAGQRLYTSLTNAEGTSNNQFTSFDSNGFTLGSDPGLQVNKSGETFVSWSWRASDSTAVSNTDGTITSTVSANTTSGFSVVTYTGNSTAGSTVGHGLGAKPDVILLKSRSDADNWRGYHSALGATKDIILNSTSGASTNSSRWNNTEPTSSVFTIGIDDGVNENGDSFVAYCFAEVEGFSKFGSFTGNGESVNGPFIYTGFRPAFVMIKRTGTGSWLIVDSARTPYNNLQTKSSLSASDSTAESTDTTNRGDLLSNGFRVASGSTSWNLSGSTYIYMAFAENPFKNSLAR